ncbi:MAG: DUF3520 domain-containing protein [Polyangiaceae bacterium]|nr:DUF3520 domain-containing protein [Polyangiaceae bacterium]
MIPPTDPRLTAYALGEMSEEERQAFEAELMQSDDAQRTVAELSSAATWLKSELAKEPSPKLEPAHREAIERAAKSPEAKSGATAPPRVAPVVPLRPSFARRAAYALAPLAVAAAALGVYVITSDKARRSEQAAISHADGEAAPVASARAMAENSRYGVPGPAATATARTYATGAVDALDMPQMMYDQAGRASPKEPGDAQPMASASSPSSVRALAARPAPAPPPENPFVETTKDTKSTFSIDVDTASYSLVRRLLDSGQLPNPNLVRIEEMVNYFTYSYPEPNDEAFGVYTDATAAPWASGHRLVRVGLKGRTIQMDKRPASNLVFLIDASGSMDSPDKIELVKKGFEMLVEQLDERDSVSIVVYAGAAGLVLPPTRGNEKKTILAALDKLKAGGSTNGGQGIQLAYETAKKAFVAGGSNRVILASDGDYNVGVTNHADLVKLIEEKAKSGVFLTVLGFGLGNLKDATMEQLADKGNGSYAYIDSLAEARKVLVDQAAGTLNTIAKDVKIQISFDPKTVQSFRLIGYENRVLAHRDFEDDTKDAGEIGAGHTVTALYEIVPKEAVSGSVHLADIALRYKQPDGATSRLVSSSVVDTGGAFADASTDFRFAASVAGFGMLLRKSPNKGGLTYAKVVGFAGDATGDDPDGHRRELVKLVSKASLLVE